MKLEFISKTCIRILSYFFPKACIICNSLVSNDGFCSKCFQNLDFITHPFCMSCGKMFPITLSDNQQLTCASCMRQPKAYDFARSLFKFNQTSRQLVHNLKYHDKTIIVKAIANLLHLRYGKEIADYDLIIPVPMHKIKRLFRFYNQAQILASELAKYTKMELNNTVLMKHKYSKTQTHLSYKERLKNITISNFKIQKPEIIKGKKIVLIDDVLTTGTTISACSKLLKDNGATKVSILSICSSTHFN